MTYTKHWNWLRSAAIVLAAALCVVPATQAAPAKERVNIIYKKGAQAKIMAAIARKNGRLIYEFPEVNAVTVELSRKAVRALKRNANVKFVEADTMQYAFALTDPSDGDPYFLGQAVPYGIPMVQADVLDDSTAGNTTLCIIDSGIDGTHPDHAGNILAGENLTTSGTWDSDESSHGTHVAGTIAAVNNPDVGVVGVLPNTNLNLYIAKVFDASGSTASSTVAKAMWGCWRRGGADVISMSLGGAGNSRLQQIVADFLYTRGVLLIAAAGNDGNSVISYPAGLDSVMSVAAIDENKAWANFSQFNETVEIAAPGVSVLSTVPVGSIVDYTATVDGTEYPALLMDGTPAATATSTLYDLGTGEAIDGAAAGQICLIQRGNISFADKVLACENSGGIGAIIYNNVPGSLSGTLGDVATTIPSVGVSDTDGALMLADVGTIATVDTLNGIVSDYDYDFFSGTSMATPHVSAVAALVWSHFPTCTNVEIRDALNATAEDLLTAGRDNFTGYGLVQALAAYDYLAENSCGL
ncbi:peptidase S8 [Mangrovimicrobium sediminis]|uniref:Peptidase S8 n=1 Tax=Mangrovimicrobium sediminis TaxID=2562682 RepID=A0A4Z0M9A6_9GAMM|nr:S8 family serine peptidase [Haliea sp. SAOS-164]TGD76099.1 peptidase S8 [Haliea sp. SAOS-164]